MNCKSTEEKGQENQYIARGHFVARYIATYRPALFCYFYDCDIVLDNMTRFLVLIESNR